VANLAHHGIGRRGEDEAASQECRAQRPGGHRRRERHGAEPTGDEGEHAEHERQDRQRTCAAIEDQHPTAVIGYYKSARVG